MRMNFLISFFISSLLLSCAKFSSRNPSSHEEEENNVGFSALIDQARWASRLHLEDAQVCKENYERLYKKLFSLASDRAFMEISDLNQIDEDIKYSFNARLEIKESFKVFKKDSTCLKSATDVFRALRYVEDYLIQVRMEKMPNPPSDYVNLKGEFPYLLVNPKYEKEFKSYEDLKSGDVILSRGNAFSSAAIARIGTNDYQFSHLSFVYQNPEDKKIMTTEAHIEIGSVVEPIEDHLENKNAREVVFRFENNEVAANASKIIHDRVLEAQNKNKPVEYDFSMNFKDDDRLFCSEIISSGFKKALPNEDFFPMFKSKFSPGIIPFLNTIGVPATNDNIDELEVFAPGDIQFDPRFELVAEWRNPTKIQDSRLKDFILTKMFERMDNAKYKIDPSFKMEAASRSLWMLRRLPIISKLVKKKLPLNMNAGQIELFMAIDKIGNNIFKELQNKSSQYSNSMTPVEIYRALGEIFSEDLKVYTEYKNGNRERKPLFHLLFHP